MGDQSRSSVSSGLQCGHMTQIIHIVHPNLTTNQNEALFCVNQSEVSITEQFSIPRNSLSWYTAVSVTLKLVWSPGTQIPDNQSEVKLVLIVC